MGEDEKGRPAPLAGGAVLLLDGGHPGVRQLGSPDGARRRVVRIFRQMDRHRGFAVLFGLCLWRFFREAVVDRPGGLPPWRWHSPCRDIRWPPSRPGGRSGRADLDGRAELKDWRDQTWGFAKQILPLLFMGVLAAGFFLGSPDSEDAGIIPNVWIQALVGDSPATIMMALMGRGRRPFPAGWTPSGRSGPTSSPRSPAR
jgi:hypothetical protein